MKPIIITEETEQKILRSFFEKFMKEWNTFKYNMNDTKFTFSTEISEVAKEKVTIIYSPKAYLRMYALVNHYDTEVGWYGLVEKIKDKEYYVYDVKVCKQYVDGGKVDTEDDDTLEFFNSLTDDEIEHMHFQGHSHVNMSTNASGIDLQNQADVIRNMGKSGFYIFQIWNKKGEISTYLYDLDSNVFYDRKDVVLDVEDSGMSISEFVKSTEKLVVEKKNKYPTYNKGKYPDYSKKDYGYNEGYYERWDY